MGRNSERESSQAGMLTRLEEISGNSVSERSSICVPIVSSNLRHSEGRLRIEESALFSA